MKTIFSASPYLLALLFATWKTHLVNWKRTLLLTTGMIVQNLLFFAMWIFLFNSIGSIKGWKLPDMGLLYSIGAITIGTTIFIFDGIRSLPTLVSQGTLDGFLVRPRRPLLPLILSRSGVGSLGDIITGFLFWFIFEPNPVQDFPLFLCVIALTLLIFISTTLIFYSLVFWAKKAGSFSEQLFHIFMILNVAPQHVQPFAMKVLIYSILPAGFIGVIPVTILHDFSWNYALLLAAAAVGYSLLATHIFYAGLNRYRR